MPPCYVLCEKNKFMDLVQARPAERARDFPREMKWIPDTDWAVVLTSLSHEYFYNSKTMQVLWEMPDELISSIGVLINTVAGGLDDSSDDSSDGDNDETPFIALSQADDSANILNEETMPLNDDNLQIIVKEDVISKPESHPDERFEIFTEMLIDNQVSPFSSWFIEEPKLSHEPRFALVSHQKERKMIFLKYCESLIAQEITSRRDKSPEEIYQELLEKEVGLRTKFDDFARKFKRDTRFAKVDLSQRQKLFNAHKDVLKKAEV